MAGNPARTSSTGNCPATLESALSLSVEWLLLGESAIFQERMFKSIGLKLMALAGIDLPIIKSLRYYVSDAITTV